MANYIVDGADLSSIADAIRAKSGGSEQLEFPSEFVSEIGSISGGVTVEPLSVAENGTYTAPEGTAYSPVVVAVTDSSAYMQQMTFLQNTLPKVAKIDGRSGASVMTREQNTLEELFVYNANNVSLQCTPCANLVKITADGTILQKLNQMCAYNSKLVEIDGLLDFSGMSANNWFNTFANCYALEEIRIKQNTINQTVSNNNFQGCTSLSDDSVVSIANGLDGESSGKSISLPSAIKTRCGQIVGTVTDGVFTQNAQGSVTLTDFITNTKGWTLA